MSDSDVLLTSFDKQDLPAWYIIVIPESDHEILGAKIFVIQITEENHILAEFEVKSHMSIALGEEKPIYYLAGGTSMIKIMHGHASSTLSGQIPGWLKTARVRIKDHLSKTVGVEVIQYGN